MMVTKEGLDECFGQIPVVHDCEVIDTRKRVLPYDKSKGYEIGQPACLRQDHASRDG